MSPSAQGASVFTSAAPLPYCLSVAAYHNFNNAVPVSLGKHVLPVGATISNVAVGGNVRYNNAGAVLPLGAGPLPLNKANCGGLQMGVRWSKTALEYALKHGHTIHFHLDGLGDIAQVIGKAGNYSHNVTTRECRYLHHHWRRFHKAVRFYNGFVHDPSTPHPRNRAYEVHPPWFRYFSTRPHPGSRAIVSLPGSVLASTSSPWRSLAVSSWALPHAAQSSTKSATPLESPNTKKR